MKPFMNAQTPASLRSIKCHFKPSVVWLFLGVLGLSLFASPTLAQTRIPGGGVATAPGKGAVKAYYAQPTARYGHAILGDAVEGGSLVVIDDKGKQHELTLSDAFVFEDVTPRIVDLDGDGRNEVVTIRTQISKGAAVAIYDVENGKLVERAATQPIGLTRRWLSIAAIDDFLGNGRRQIAIVKTPHIGGKLELLSLRGNTISSAYPPTPGFSTHYIGLVDVSLAVGRDIDKDGAAELILPSDDYRRISVLSFGHSIAVRAALDLTSALSRPLKLMADGDILAPMRNGKTTKLSFELN